MNCIINIAVVDDHELYVEGACNLLESESKQYKTYGYNCAVDLLEDCTKGQNYDIIITDMAMKGMNGLALIAALRSNEISTPVIITSGVAENSEMTTQKFIDMGATAFSHKSDGASHLALTVHSVIRNLQTVDTDAKSPENPVAKHEHDQVTAHELSERQLDVLQYLARGFSNTQIASELGITDHTVKSHLQKIYVHLDVKNRSSCVTTARELGIL